MRFSRELNWVRKKVHLGLSEVILNMDSVVECIYPVFNSVIHESATWFWLWTMNVQRTSFTWLDSSNDIVFRVFKILTSWPCHLILSVVSKLWYKFVYPLSERSYSIVDHFWLFWGWRLFICCWCWYCIKWLWKWPFRQTVGCVKEIFYIIVRFIT